MASPPSAALRIVPMTSSVGNRTSVTTKLTTSLLTTEISPPRKMTTSTITVSMAVSAGNGSAGSIGCKIRPSDFT